MCILIYTYIYIYILYICFIVENSTTYPHLAQCLVYYYMYICNGSYLVKDKLFIIKPILYNKFYYFIFFLTMIEGEGKMMKRVFRSNKILSSPYLPAPEMSNVFRIFFCHSCCGQVSL